MTSTTKTIVGAGCVTAGAAALILFFCDPGQVPIYPTCMFHQITGLDCPGCGSLRALHHLLHGEVGTALRFNAFLILSLPIFAWFGLRFVWSKMNRQPAAPFRVVWVWFYLGAFIAFGILRDLPVPFFAAFAP